MRQIIHNRKNCIGCGVCAILSPTFYEIDKKDGLANLKKSTKIKNHYVLKTKQSGFAVNAAEGCPVTAIKV